MMYQCLSAIPPAPSTAADAENERHDETHDLVRQQEEDRRDRDHHEDHRGGDGGLAPGRPGDLLGLGAHLLQELERTDLRHSLPAAPLVTRHNPLKFRLLSRAGLRLAGVEGLEPPTPGFGDRCSSQLSYTPPEALAQKHLRRPRPAARL